MVGNSSPILAFKLCGFILVVVIKPLILSNSNKNLLFMTIATIH